MKRFVAVAFVVAYLLAYTLGDGRYRALDAIAAATLLTVIGALVARRGGQRWGAATMTVLAGLMALGS